ncbi:MAG: NAD(+)/NADH kinase [Lachnospiraceae bacterium]|nr:NAD(+)/NADH kinase [Lachnospiraceae bacterium]
MKNFLIITNDNKDPNHDLTDKIKKYIERKNGKAHIAAKAMDGNGGSIIPEDMEFDCVLVLGGDGTMLRAARDIMKRGIPMLGINLGTRGFLADVEKDSFEPAIDALFEGIYFIQKRMTVKGCIETSDGKKIELPPALNDITVTRQGSLHVMHVELYVNGQFLCNLGVDGILAATPTGSTGYNLSAGGPIVHPGANMIVITPICAHTLNARSIVVGPDETIEFVIAANRDGEHTNAEASSDGNKPCIMKTGDKIKIVRSEDTVSLIKLDQRSFLQTLNYKMGSSML